MTVQWGLGSVLWRGTGKPGTVVGAVGGTSLATGTLVRSPQLEAIRALPVPPGPRGMMGLCSSPLSCSPSGQSLRVLQAPSLLPLLLPRADTKIFLPFLWKNPGRSVYGQAAAATSVHSLAGAATNSGTGVRWDSEYAGTQGTCPQPTSVCPLLPRITSDSAPCLCRQPWAGPLCTHL